MKLFQPGSSDGPPPTAARDSPSSPRWRALIGKEWFLAASVATALVFLRFGASIQQGLSNRWWLACLFIWLFAVVLGSALSVARHANRIAVWLGEPYGTLVLTISVTSIEVMTISSVMLHGNNNPALVRNTLFSVTMISLNGMIGLSLLLGGWRHREQEYNLQGTNAYMGVIIPLAVLNLIMPDFTAKSAGSAHTFAQDGFLVLMSAGLYLAFLAIQTTRHHRYFAASNRAGPAHAAASLTRPRELLGHVFLLAAYMVPVVFVSRQLAIPLDYMIETMHMPIAMGGIAVALLVALPEATAAVRAALTNQMQRSLNISLGSVLSTIGLTVPLMLVISHLTGRNVVLGLPGTDSVMLLLTLTVCIVTFTNGRTNILQGLVHLLLFGAYLLLAYQG